MRFKDSKHSRHYGFVQGPLLKMSRFNALTNKFISHFSDHHDFELFLSHGWIYIFWGKFNGYSGWIPGKLRYSSRKREQQKKVR